MLTLAAIALTTPMMLAGLAGLALPIAAHLLFRKARRRVVFPTIRLLEQSAASVSNLFKLRRWLLLVLRCLAVALIVLAFTRPVWTDAPAMATSTETGEGIVLLLDVSASSAQVNDGAAVIESMRAMAHRVLDDAVPGLDRVNIILAGARPRAVLPQLSANIETVRAELADFAPTQQRADLPRALALAAEQLQPHAGPRRIVLISDMQATNLAELIAGDRDLTTMLPDDVHISLLPTLSGDAGNVALSRARLAPARPRAGQPVQLLVHVSNFADDAAEVEVQLLIDDKPAAARAIMLDPRQGRDLVFEHTFADIGAQRITFAISADALAADNRAYLVAEPVHRLPVAVVTDDDPDQPGTSGYFLTRALAPRGDASDAIDARHLAGRDLASVPLHAFAAVMVGNIGALTDDAARTLVRYVERGGGLVMFCAEGPMDDNAKALQAAAGDEPFVPWQPMRLRDEAALGGFATLGEGAWRSEPMRVFDEASRRALQRVRVFKRWETSDPAPAAQRLLTYRDDLPALSAHSFGGGRVVLANFGLALTASDLGKFGSVVALCQRLVDYLQPAGDHTGPRQHVGEAMTVAIDLGDDTGALHAVGPEAQPRAVEPAGRAFVALPDTPAAGFYDIMLDDRVLRTVAINLDPRESDLRAADTTTVAQALRDRAASVRIAGGDDAAPVLADRGRPLWHALLIGAMVALALELLLIGLWRQ